MATFNYEDDVPEVDNDDVAELTKLARQAVQMENEIAALEERLNEAKERHRQLVEVTLPEALMEKGVKEIKLIDDRVLGYETKVVASITERNKPEAFDWLRKHGHDDLIKHEIKTVFGRGEEERAEGVKALLSAHNVPFKDTETVHWQTLRAFVREQMDKGNPPPSDLFGVHIINRAFIK